MIPSEIPLNRNPRRLLQCSTASGATGLAALAVSLLSCEPHPRTAAEATLETELPILLQLGARDTPSQEVFGRIEDVTIDVRGRLFLLDSRPPSMHVFEVNGEHLFSWDSRGKGPGEFTAPTQVAVNEEGAVVVADRVRLVLMVFEENEGRLTHRRDIRIPGVPLDLCLLGGLAIVPSSTAEAIFLVDLQSDQIEVVPFPFETNPLARGSFSLGDLVCPTRTSLGAWNRLFTGAVTFLGPNGHPVEQRVLPNFRPIDTFTVGNRFSQRPPAGGFSVANLPGRLSETELVLQVTHLPRGGEKPGRRVDPLTFLLTLDSIVGPFAGIPRLSFVRPPFAVSVKNDSVPTVTIFALDGGFAFR